jgi:hypothetical protein
MRPSFSRGSYVIGRRHRRRISDEEIGEARALFPSGVKPMAQQADPIARSCILNRRRQESIERSENDHQSHGLSWKAAPQVGLGGLSLSTKAGNKTRLFQSMDESIRGPGRRPQIPILRDNHWMRPSMRTAVASDVLRDQAASLPCQAPSRDPLPAARLRNKAPPSLIFSAEDKFNPSNRLEIRDVHQHEDCSSSGSRS